MNILTKVTLKQLLKNKVRTVVTIVGIILSAAMITAVTSSVSTFIHFFQETAIATEGYWHLTFSGVDGDGVRELESDERFDSAVSAQVLGYARREEIRDSSVYGQYLYVLGADDGFFDRIPIDITEGRMPENAGELVICKQAQYSDYFRGELPKLGSQITLELGDRYYDGERLDKYNPLMTDEDGNLTEELRFRESRTYTVVGFYSRPYIDTTIGGASSAYTLWDDTSSADRADMWILLKKPGDAFDFQKDHSQLAGSEDNTDYLMSLGVTRYNAFYSVITGMAAVLIGLIMFGSVSLIYNAFSISVAERTKQFGLLRSVGATRRQTRRMVFDEAMILSAVGIPLGILSGVLGMAVTYHFIGDDLARIFAGQDGHAVKLRLSLSVLSVATAAVIGFITVLISAWVPSRRATRISAIEAIRQSNDVSVKRREVKTSPLTYRLFGLEGAIAGKHFKRDRKRYRATVVSLFMSVVLFISASSFCRYLTDSVEGVFTDHDYDISYSYFGDRNNDGQLDEGQPGVLGAAEILSAVDGVTGVTPCRTLDHGNMFFTRDMLSDVMVQLMDDENQYQVSFSTPEYDNVSEKCYEFSPFIYAVGEDAYREYLISMGVKDVDEYFGDDPKIVVKAQRRYQDENGAIRIIDLLRDDVETLELPFLDDIGFREAASTDEYHNMSLEERDEVFNSFITYKTYRVGLITDKLPMGLNSWDTNSVVIVIPFEEGSKLEPGLEDGMIYFTADDHEKVYDNLIKAAADAGLTDTPGEFYDVYAISSYQRGMVKVVRVLSYGFITLISLIAAANVFNTVSTNILLRRREFAMLRSVGMTNRGFNRMMNFECILYGTKSLVFGVPAAFAVTYLIFRAVQSGYDIGFYLPWGAVAVAVGSVFLVVFATMMYSMSIIKRDNPIEAMKNEVI